MVSLTYLSSENAFLVNPYGRDIPPYISFRDGINNLIHSVVVVGDEYRFDPHIELCIYEKLVRRAQGVYEWILVPCLQYRDEHIINRDKHEFEALCEFPHFIVKEDEKLIQLGFEVERMGEDGVYTDPFGEMQLTPTTVKYKKNGVEFNYMYY